MRKMRLEDGSDRLDRIPFGSDGGGKGEVPFDLAMISISRFLASKLCPSWGVALLECLALWRCTFTIKCAASHTPFVCMCGCVLLSTCVVKRCAHAYIKNLHSRDQYCFVVKVDDRRLRVAIVTPTSLVGGTVHAAAFVSCFTVELSLFLPPDWIHDEEIECLSLALEIFGLGGCKWRLVCA
jgi:hypothetical protein